MSVRLASVIADRVRMDKCSRPAICWKIEITQLAAPDVYLTDHPHALTLADGNTYLPSNGVETSNRRREAAMKEANKEGHGIITTEQITDAMMQAGVLLEARITEQLVDWFFPYNPPIESITYEVDSVEDDGDAWVLNIVNLATLLTDQIGDVTGGRCRVELFSTGPGMCNASPTGHSFAVTVTSVFEARTYFDTDETFGAPLSVFRNGRIEWQTGDNDGSVSMAKEVLASDPSRIRLAGRTLYPIQVGDTCIVFKGCNHLAGVTDNVGHCKPVFDNLVNYQGELAIPGRNRTTRGVADLQ